MDGWMLYGWTLSQSNKNMNSLNTIVAEEEVYVPTYLYFTLWAGSNY